ncbi:hypothetical protein HDU91_005893 [Kappamyces sp. JEL0680]|nr:hypothetical protein HDU91_005893 [Kappamyces sp. JEL0680]
MKWGDKPVKDFAAPSSLVLAPVAFWTLFWFPLQVQWRADPKTFSKKTIYVGNQQVYGNGTLSIIAAIYQKTGSMPRIVADPLNFKLPFWKHLIQYFGAVDRSQPDALEALCESGATIVYFPGSDKEFLKSSSSAPYDLDFNPQLLLEVLACQRNFGYHIVPFSSVGASDMVKTLFDVPYNPNDFSYTFPVVVPVSYQRQYMVVGEPRKQYEQTLPSYLPLVKECTKMRDDALALQTDAGDSRYLLGSLHRIGVAFGNVFLQNDGIIVKSARRVRKSAGQALVYSAKRVLQSLQETPGVTITELEE